MPSNDKLKRQIAYASSFVPTKGMGRLCIVTTGRAGTELLVDLLNSHPRMHCDGEILETPFRDPVRYVKGRAALAKLRKNDAYGFKINHLNSRIGSYRTTIGQVIKDLAGDGFALLRVRRDNLLRQTISALRAGAERRYHTHEERERAPIHLDPVEVIYWMHNYASVEERIDGYVRDIPHTTLVYEHDLEDPETRDASLARVFALVGLEPTTTQTSLRRSTPRGLADAVANHEEIRDILGRTRFAKYLFD